MSKTVALLGFTGAVCEAIGLWKCSRQSCSHSTADGVCLACRKPCVPSPACINGAWWHMPSVLAFERKRQEYQFKDTLGNIVSSKPA